MEVLAGLYMTIKADLIPAPSPKSCSELEYIASLCLSPHYVQVCDLESSRRLLSNFLSFFGINNKEGGFPRIFTQIRAA